MFANIWNHPKTSIAGILICLVTVAGVFSQQGITLGQAGTGTVVALVGALATALLGLLSKDPNSTSGSGSAAKLGVLLLICGLPVVLCTGFQGCSSAGHDASEAAASIGASLQTAATINNDMLQSGEESQQEAATVALYINDAAEANDAFVKTVQALPSGGSKITAAQAVAAFQALQAQISVLNQQGVLHLKSQKAQTAFATVMVSIQGAITTVQAVIAVTSSHRGSPLRPFLPAAPMLGLVLTPAEIEELIALALAAGSALVTKLESLRGETDPQLQSSALAADAAAEQEAQADELAQNEISTSTTTD